MSNLCVFQIGAAKPNATNYRALYYFTVNKRRIEKTCLVHLSPYVVLRQLVVFIMELRISQTYSIFISVTDW